MKLLFCISFWAGWLYYVQVWQFINHPDKEIFVTHVGWREVGCETDRRGACHECPVGLFNSSALPLPLLSSFLSLVQRFDKLQSTTLKLKTRALFVCGRDTVIICVWLRTPGTAPQVISNYPECCTTGNLLVSRLQCCVHWRSPLGLNVLDL